MMRKGRFCPIFLFRFSKEMIAYDKDTVIDRSFGEKKKPGHPYE